MEAHQVAIRTIHSRRWADAVASLVAGLATYRIGALTLDFKGEKDCVKYEVKEFCPRRKTQQSYAQASLTEVGSSNGPSRSGQMVTNTLERPPRWEPHKRKRSPQSP